MHFSRREKQTTFVSICALRVKSLKLPEWRDGLTPVKIIFKSVCKQYDS